MDDELYKIKSLELFKKYNLPVLPYEVLEREDYKSQIVNFSEKHQLSNFMVRTDGKGKFSPSINNATLKKDEEQILKFFDEGYTVIISHPGDIFKNFHAINVMKSGEEIVLEVVGPGFDMHDLNKGGMVHEEIILDLSLNIVKNKIIEPERYQTDIKKRSAKFSEKELRENHSYLLEHKEYVPMSKEEIEFIKKSLPGMEAMAKELGFNDFIASLSFIDLGSGKNEPIFWDLYGI